MTRSRFARAAFAVIVPLAMIALTSLPGCGEEERPSVDKPENAPAAKGKDSMEYFRKNMMKKGGTKGSSTPKK